MKGSRKAAFRLIALAFPVVLLGIAELLVRMLIAPEVAEDLKLNLVGMPLFFETTEIDGEPYYRMVHADLYRSRDTTFPVEKSPDAVRIFCLGGSASAGWPHPAEESYSAYLEEALRRAFPHKTIEMINVGAHAYAAYRVRLIFDKVIDFDPDLIVLYSGNNEFLERRTYGVSSRGVEWATSAANRMVLFRLLRSRYLSAMAPERSLSAMTREDRLYEVWSKTQQQALELRADPVQFEQVREHYAYTIESMLKRGADRGVPVVLATVPVNLRSWHPNVSHNGLHGSKRKHWEAAWRAGRRALLEQDAAAAIEHLQLALELEPLHADSHFHLGRAYESRADSNRALVSFRRAADLDYNPFRAVSSFNDSLRNIAGRNENAYLADAERAFLAASAPFAPGFDLFLDYVHPSKKGNLEFAKAVFDTIVEAELLGEPPEHRVFSVEAKGTYDELHDRNLQWTLFRLFGMMHQYESIVDKARQYDSLPDCRWPFIRTWREVFSDFVELERKELLGIPVDDAEKKRILSAYRRLYENKFGPDGKVTVRRLRRKAQSQQERTQP